MPRLTIASLALVVSLVAGPGAGIAGAQSLTGTVKDISGAVLPGASVNA